MGTGSSPQSFGRYQLEEELGRGSWGVVYRARRAGLERDFALKILLGPTQDPDDSETLERFLLEARIASKLDDPGFVPVHDVGTVDGRWYLAMDYCPGPTLKERLAEGPLPVDEAVALVVGLARTMQVAHQAGVLHRDLKPANVILEEPSGRARITDFGMARDRDLRSSLTKSGDVLGTPAYMSPEQVLGDRNLDGRADLYALAVILYECLAGRRPLDAPSVAGLMRSVLEQIPPPPSRFRVGLAPALDAFCARGLAKRREDRPADASAFAAELEVAARGVVSSARVGRGALVGVGLLAAALTGGLAAVLAGGEPQRSEPEHVPHAPASIEATAQVTVTPRDETWEERFQRVSAETRAIPFERGLERLDALTDSAFTRDQREACRLEVILHHIRRGRYRRAEELLKGFPNASFLGRTELRFLVLEVNEGQRQGWSARRQLLPGLAEEPGALGHVAQARLMVSAGRREDDPRLLKEAVHEARVATELAPGESRAWTALGLAYLALGDESAAEQALAQAEEISPGDARVHVGMVFAIRRSSDPPVVALRAVDRFLDLTQGSRSHIRTLTLKRRAEKRLEAGDRSGAQRDLAEALLGRPFDMRVRFLNGVALLELGRDADAQAELRRAHALAPEYGSPGGEVRRLADLVREFAGLSPGLSEAVAEATHYESWAAARTEGLAQPVARALSRALRAAAAGEPHAEVLLLLEEVERLAPEDPTVAMEVARVRVGRDLDSAAALGRARGLVSEPGLTHELEYLEAEALRRQGRLGEALDRFQTLARSQPETPYVICAEARSQLLSDQSDAAASAAARVLELEPKHVTALLLRGEALQGRDPDQAVKLAIEARALQGDLDLQALITVQSIHVHFLMLGRRAWLPHHRLEQWLELSAGAHGLACDAGLFLELGLLNWDPNYVQILGARLFAAQDREPERGDSLLLRGHSILLQGGEADLVVQLWADAREREPLATPTPAWVARFRDLHGSTPALQAFLRGD